MDSTVIPKSTETATPTSTQANDVLAARADERLAHAYEQIARADEQLARLTEQLTKMEQEPARQPAAIRARRPSRGRTALRGLIGLVAAAFIIGGAFVSQSSYGEAIKPAIARWAGPYVGSVSWLAQSAPELPAQPAPSAVRLAAAEPASSQGAPSAGSGPQDSASPAGAAASPELTQLVQAIARDLTTVQQGIEELKASQERLASDNARAVEQFKASQEEMTRLVAKVSEQEQRAKLPPPPPRPAADPARKPAQAAQARTKPLQLQPTAR
jgi:predicted FMN-binding regulatory protein PaiB